MHIIILDNCWLKDKISHKMMMKILCRTFLEWEKMASKKIFWHFLHSNVFIFVFLLSNHTFSLVQFGIKFHLWVFQKAEIALAEAACAISSFRKTCLCKLIPNWMGKTIWLPKKFKIEWLISKKYKNWEIYAHVT